MHTATTYDIPAAYGVTFLTLLVRDPRCIFAQWEVTETDRLDAARRAVALRGAVGATPTDRTQLVLRLYDVTGTDRMDIGSNNGHPDTAFTLSGTFIDIVVDGRQSRYITLNEAGHAFTAQIGVQVQDDPGTFTVISASNTVQTPPGRPSNQFDSTWLTSDELFRTAGELAGTVRRTERGVRLEVMWEEQADAFSPGFTMRGPVPMFASADGPSGDGSSNQEGSG